MKHDLVKSKRMGRREGNGKNVYGCDDMYEGKKIVKMISYVLWKRNSFEFNRNKVCIKDTDSGGGGRCGCNGLELRCGEDE